MRVGRRHRNKRALTIVANGTVQFDTAVSHTNGFLRWDMGDGTVYDNTTNPFHTYADTAQYTITAYKRLMETISSIQGNVDDIVSVDMGSCTGIGGNSTGSITFENNPNLVAFTFPKDQLDSLTGVCTFLRFDNTNLATAVDLTGMKRMRGSFWFQSTDIPSFDASSPLTGGDITSVQLQVCNLLTTVDISGMVEMRAVLQLRNCALLNSIVFPNTTGISVGNMTSMQIYGCPNLPVIDLTNMENAGGIFRAYQNNSMTAINLPAVPTAPLTELRVDSNNALNTALDFSNFTHTGSQIRFNSCPNLPSFVPPVSADITLLWGYNNTSITSYDFSNITVARNSIVLRTCPNLTSVTFNSTPHTGEVNQFLIYDCNLTTLDVSMFQNLGRTTGTGNREFDVHNNPNLTSITHSAVLATATLIKYYAHDCNLSTLDVSKLNINTDFRVHGNPNLSSITLNPNTGSFNHFLVYNCNLSTLNLTGFTGGFRQFQCYGNPNLTSVTFDPAIVMASGNGTSYRFDGCDLTTLDISMFNLFGGLFWAYNNINLNTLSLPTSSVAITDMRVYNTALTSVDFSTLLGFAGRIEFNQNALTSVTFPTVSASFNNFFFSFNTSLGYIDFTPLNGSTFGSVAVNNIGATTAQVNQMLVEFDSIVGTVTGAEQIRIDNNSAPDATSGGFDGLAAKTSLQAKGWTVTTD